MLDMILLRAWHTVVSGAKVLLVLVLASAGWASAPQIETRLFPVSTDYIVESWYWRDHRHLVVFPSFRKVRGCRFVSQEWLIGSMEDFSRAMLTFEDEKSSIVQSRPNGRNHAGPWVIDMPLQGDLSKHWSWITHDCGLPWQTHTRVGPFDFSAAMSERPAP